MEKLDIRTLKYLKGVFENRRDFSKKCDGYKFICGEIKKLENTDIEEYDQLLEDFYERRT
jgi:hypothetical protein